MVLAWSLSFFVHKDQSPQKTVEDWRLQGFPEVEESQFHRKAGN